eukprot:2263237-Rhodomonas_salina.1
MALKSFSSSFGPLFLSAQMRSCSCMTPSHCSTSLLPMAANTSVCEPAPRQSCSVRAALRAESVHRPWLSLSLSLSSLAVSVSVSVSFSLALARSSCSLARSSCSLAFLLSFLALSLTLNHITHSLSETHTLSLSLESSIPARHCK